MGNNQTDKSNQSNDNLLKEKTNQDYNKKEPNPNDPNETKIPRIEDKPKEEINANNPDHDIDSYRDGESNKDGKHYERSDENTIPNTTNRDKRPGDSALGRVNDDKRPEPGRNK